MTDSSPSPTTSNAPPRVPKAVKRFIWVAFVLLALYALVGFVVLPQGGRWLANRLLQDYLSVPTTVARIELNPFTGELGIYDVAVGEAGKERISFSRLWIDLEMDSAWTGAVHLRTVALDNATLAAQMSAVGTLDLLDLVKRPAESAQKSETDAAKKNHRGLFPLRIDQVLLSQAHLRWQDLRYSPNVDIEVTPLTLTLEGVSTVSGEPGKLHLLADAGKAGHLEVDAGFTIPEQRAKGRISLQKSRLTRFWPYVQSRVPVVLNKGELDASVDFMAEAGEPLQLSLDNGAFTLRGLAVSDRQKAPLLAFSRLQVAPVTVSLHDQRVAVGSVLVEGLNAPLIREADSRLNWQRVLVLPASGGGKVGPKETQSAAPWQVAVSELQVREAALPLLDQAVAPAQPPLDVGIKQLRVQHYDSGHSAPLVISLDATLGAEGRVQAEGRLDLAAMSAQLQVQTQHIDLRVAQPYLKPFVRMELRGGLLDAQLQVDLPRFDPLALNVGGDVVVHQLHTVDTLKNQDLLKWQQLQVKALQYEHGQRLDIQELWVQAPYVRFVINENLSTNVSELVIPPVVAADTVPVTAVSSSGEVSGNSEPAGEGLAIRIGGIAIADGSANFADFSLTPNFASAIAQLNGSVGVLDNRQSLPVGIDIHGKVDRYAPVSIVGSLTPFDPLHQLDINAKFKRVELTTLTPYSGKFAGYRIRKGRLNLDLHYKIDAGQLAATNKVVLEELQLGEKVDSPDAVDLPVRLAVALLKDARGNIKVELPIEGDLNNPKFSVGPVLWKTLRNLIVRVMKSPFSFISGLLDSGESENLDAIAFAPGSSELTTEATGKLKTVATALNERQHLRLEVEGASAQRTDGEPMAQQLLAGEFRKAYAKHLQLRGQALPADEGRLWVPDNEKPALLVTLYAELFDKPIPAEWMALPDTERAAALEQAIVDRLGESERRLRQLARERAARIKEWLVEVGGLSDERIYLLNAQLRDDKPGDAVASMLYLDSE